MKVINFIALLLVILGGINWLLVGVFEYNAVERLLGTTEWLDKLVYLVVGIAAIYCISFFKKVCK
ncbi:DUF378 domain-containing protein [Thiotrichales bacterium 19X7-9]|nr:DUF378 domain-containing protein [Thiotrichales bacterium 19X7-9]TNF65425.1 MAG: DUF378 domain-containing protein [Gammaproteobacteria bacterium]UTW43004.1 DUF378 domain-containing protein [bacterium SCSIO 12844]